MYPSCGEIVTVRYLQLRNNVCGCLGGSQTFQRLTNSVPLENAQVPHKSHITSKNFPISCVFGSSSFTLFRSRASACILLLSCESVRGLVHTDAVRRRRYAWEVIAAEDLPTHQRFGSYCAPLSARPVILVPRASRAGISSRTEQQTKQIISGDPSRRGRKLCLEQCMRRSASRTS